MSERKQNKVGSSVVPHRAKRKRAPREHEVEAVSVDFIDDSQLRDGDPSNISVEPQGLPGRGERALLAAMLSSAIEEAKRGDVDARAWLLDDVEVGTLNRYTCRQVLAHLSIDADAFAERVKDMISRGEPRQAVASPDRDTIADAVRVAA